LGVQVGAPGNWDHIINQIGMFSYTGLSKVCVGVLHMQLWPRLASFYTDGLLAARVHVDRCQHEISSLSQQRCAFQTAASI
jgi:hypothetical protein